MHVYSNVPFKKGGRITDDFTKVHKARDVAPRNDDDGQVFAIEGGTITDTQDGMAQGDSNANMVIVRGADQALTVYAHVAPSVSPNVSVKRGTRIGDVDMSGDSTGLHVHLARLPGGDGTVDDVLNRQDKGVFYNFKSLGSW